MAWKIESITTDKIPMRRTRSEYVELYNRILELKIGQGLQVTMDGSKKAENVRNSIHDMLKKKGMAEKFIASNRGNIVYVGRTK